MTAARLAANHVRKKFQYEGSAGVLAIEDITLAIAPQEFVSVVGPSGCGKSTFLRIVAGLDRDGEGEILVDGKRVSGPGADRGMVFQEYALLPWKTTLANVAFGLQLRGVPKDERLDIAQRYVDLVGLKGFENHYPHQLSGGMRQRAAVARALANQPTVLLMDEPFAAIDAINRKFLQEELTDIAVKEKMTVLFITHSIDEAVFLSDRILILSARPSRIAEEARIGLPRPRRWDDVINQPEFISKRDHVLKIFHKDSHVAQEHI